MFRPRFALVLAVATGALAVVSARKACAGVVDPPALRIVSQSVHVDLVAQSANFSMVFDHTPDFALRDDVGRRADSFQYEIVPDATDITQTDFFDIHAVIRGDEIRASRLPIRDGIQDGRDSGDDSGGWGPLRGTVPYSLAGPKLTFAAPLQMLASPDGLFAYRVFTTHFGETVNTVNSNSIVPLPSAAKSAVVFLGLMGMLVIVRKPFLSRGSTIDSTRDSELRVTVIKA